MAIVLQEALRGLRAFYLALVRDAFTAEDVIALALRPLV